MAPRRITEQLLLFFDTETTGLETETDRVVQFGHVSSRGDKVLLVEDVLVNPGQPIPEQASAVHKIHDSDVASAASFAVIGFEIAQILLAKREVGGAPLLCGYNAIAYDVPLLNAEFRRHGNAAVIDATMVLDPLVWLRFYKRMWRSRTLIAASAQFGVAFECAHRASADAEATSAVMHRMIELGIIPDDVDEALAKQAEIVAILKQQSDLYGRFLYVGEDESELESGDVLRLAFGKHTGVAVRAAERGYLRWMLGLEDLPPRVRSEIDAALAMHTPRKESDLRGVRTLEC